MNKSSELSAILGNYFNWNKARLDCLAKILLALFALRTVNLSEMALAFPSKANVESRYKRLQTSTNFYKRLQTSTNVYKDFLQNLKLIIRK